MGSGGLFDFGIPEALSAVSSSGQPLTVPAGSLMSEMAPTLTDYAKEQPITWVDGKPVFASGMTNLMKMLGKAPGLLPQQGTPQQPQRLQGASPPQMPTPPRLGGGGGVGAQIPFPSMSPQQIKTALAMLLTRLGQTKTGF